MISGPGPVLISYGNFLFKYRNAVFPIILLLLLVIFSPEPVAGNGDLYLDFLGILIVIAGQVIRAMVIGLAYIKRGGMNKKVYADELVTAGLFSHCRNPLYLGNILILSGLLVVHNNVWVYGLGLGFFLISYSSIVMAEESYLQDKFGDYYTAYCENTPRWRIKFHGLGRTFEDMQFNWQRVILKDYSTMMTWSITLGLLFVRQAISFHGLENSTDTIAKTAVLIFVILSAGFYIRMLKKSGRLSEVN